MNDLEAALALAQLRRLPGLVDARARLAARYAQRLAGLRWARPPARRAGRALVPLRGRVAHRPRRRARGRLREHGVAAERPVTDWRDAAAQEAAPVAARAYDAGRLPAALPHADRGRAGPGDRRARAGAVIASINQPAYLPWLGYFDRILRSDVHIVLDHVQFEKNSFTNRNKVRTPDGWTWLSVPVQTKGRFGDLAIDRLEVANERPWARKHWDTLRFNYRRAAHFDAEAPFWEDIYARHWERLLDLQRTTLDQALARLGIGTRLLSSAALGVGGDEGRAGAQPVPPRGRDRLPVGPAGPRLSRPRALRRGRDRAPLPRLRPPHLPAGASRLRALHGRARRDAVPRRAAGAASCWRPRRDPRVHSRRRPSPRRRRPVPRRRRGRASTTTATSSSRTRCVDAAADAGAARREVPELPHGGLRPRPLHHVRVHVAGARPSWSRSTTCSSAASCRARRCAELREHCERRGRALLLHADERGGRARAARRWARR